MAKIDDKPPVENQNSNQSDFWKNAGWRWIVIILILVVLTVVFIRFPVCEETVAGDKTIEICRRLAITDIPVIAAGILIIVFAYPLFSEFSIFGVSLKRDVAANAKKTEKLEDRVDNILMIASANASSEVNIHYPPTLKEVRQAIEDPRFAYSRQKVGEELPSFRESLETLPAESSEALAQAQLIRDWSKLEKFVYAPTEGSRYRRELSPFGADYREQIDVVRKTRNAVAHGEDTRYEVLMDAVELARTLLILAENQ